jgi:uncharacterized membrane protein
MTGSETSSVPSEHLPSSAKENLELLSNFKDREEAQISGLQLTIERISQFCGSPPFFAFAVLFIASWIAVNAWGIHAHWDHVDTPPFFWLQGLVSSVALLFTVAVLIRQNRMSQMAEHRAHLDLQINMLTEQKVTKLLQIVDELRHRVTELRGRPAADADADADADAEVGDLTEPADAHALMHAIKEKHSDR